MAKSEMKAVIKFGGVQHVVGDGDIIEARAGKDSAATAEVPVLMTYTPGSDSGAKIGTPELSGVTVKLKKIEERKGDKVQSVRFKAKKRVHKVRGHRDILTTYSVSL